MSKAVAQPHVVTWALGEMARCDSPRATPAILESVYNGGFEAGHRAAYRAAVHWQLGLLGGMLVLLTLVLYVGPWF